MLRARGERSDGRCFAPQQERKKEKEKLPAREREEQKPGKKAAQKPPKSRSSLGEQHSLGLRKS